MPDPPTPSPAAGYSGDTLATALTDAADRLEQAAVCLNGLSDRVDVLLHTVQGLHAAAAASEDAAAAGSASAVAAAERSGRRAAAQAATEAAAARAVLQRQAADEAGGRVRAREAAALGERVRQERAAREAPAATTVALPGPRPRRDGPRSARRLGVIPAILFCVGTVAVTDAVVTVMWQEPFSRLYASREQAELRGQLRTLEEQPVLPAVRLPPKPVDRMAQLASALGRKAAPGSAIGRVSIPSIGARFVMVQGTGEASLRRGPGHYAGTAMPGLHGTVGVAGHRTTYLAPFRRINELRKGSAVTLQMPYGTYEYRVTRNRIVLASQGSVLSRTARDQVVLTACHPLYSAAKRIVVTARLVRAVPKGAALSRAGGGAAAARPRPA